MNKVKITHGGTIIIQKNIKTIGIQAMLIQKTIIRSGIKKLMIKTL